MSLRVALAPECAPDATPQLTLIAEGHFPARESQFVPVNALDDRLRLPGFPGETLQYRLQGTGGASALAGLARVPEEGSADVLVLPLSRSCRALRGAGADLQDGTLTAYGDSRLLWVGLERADAPQPLARRILLSRDRVHTVDEGLFVPRLRASATSRETEVVVVGGSQLSSVDAPALASFERYDTTAEGFVALGRLEQARADHAAVRAADGSVWVAGGIDRGRRLDSLERLAPDAEDFVTLGARLHRASSELALRALDDGSVVALDFSEPGPPVVQRFAAGGSEGSEVDELPVATAPALVVSLPGSRLLAFEVEDGRTTGRLCLRFIDGGERCLADWLTPFAGLSEARAMALRDGRVLLAGEADGGPVGRIIDVGRRIVTARTLDAVPHWLGALGDGSVALAGPGRIDVLREDTLSALSTLPETLLAPDAMPLALDVADHWRWRGLSLTAQRDGAHAWLAGLRFEHVRIRVLCRGGVELLVGSAGQSGRSVRVDGDDVGPALCTIRHDAGDEVELVRDGSTLEVQTSGRTERCTVGGLEGPIRLGLRAVRAGARVERLEVERL